MNTIYRSAEMVAIWLGPAAHDSDLAFDKMKEWKVRFDELKEQFDASEELAVTSISSDVSNVARSEVYTDRYGQYQQPPDHFALRL